MAVNTTTGVFSFMEFPLSMSRQGAFPLDKNSVFASMNDANTYAQSNPTAYVGQVIAVVENGTSTIYQIKNEAGTLEPLGTGDLEGDVGNLITAQLANTDEIDACIGEVYPDETDSETT